TLEQWADDVLAVMDAARSTHAALVGHAEGVPMAMLFAASHPERTTALVLMEGFARLQRDIDYPHGIAPEQVATFLRRYEERWGTEARVDQLARTVAAVHGFRGWYGRYDRCAMGRGASTAVYGSPLLGIAVRPLPPTIHAPPPVPHTHGNRHVRLGHGQYLA